MKRHRPLRLRALVTVGVLMVAAGTVVSTTLYRTPAKAPAEIGALIGANWHAIRVAAAHLTTAQVTEAAALAWLIFVLSLVLLARSKPKELRTQEKVRDSRNAVTDPEQDRAPRPGVSHGAAETTMPTLPVRSVPVGAASGVGAAHRGAQAARPVGTVASAPAALSPVVEPRIEDVIRPKGLGAGSRGRTLEPTQGHTLALTGVTQACDRLLPYGLFVVAEDVGVSSGGGTASQRAVTVIAEHMAPALAGGLVVGSAQRRALLKMAVLHADIDAAQQRIRAARDLEVAATAALVMDGVAHIATIGMCHTYRFRRHDGLMDVTPGEAATTPGTWGWPLEDEALHTHAPQDSACSAYEGGAPIGTEMVRDVYIEPNDLLLLASPGFWLALPQPHIEAILRAAPDARAAAKLLAHEAGSRVEGQDFGIVVVRPLEGWSPSFGIAAARAGLL